ncbi:hypothetical protein GGI12_002317 [Dipsacomyces acuminosporus]|nr:hypothetical protein GGI12_002317 [Dipsacomyces acuminosporus]
MESARAEKQYLVGAAGKEKIKRMMSLGKPKQAILDFGSENGLDIPAAASIYGLLDSLGHSRQSIHNAVLDSAIVAAKNRILTETVPNVHHLALLAKIKPYLAIPRLQHLPLLLLAKQPTLMPDDYREVLRSNTSLYNECSLDVKRELWRGDLALFKQHMRPLIKRYCEDDQLLEMSKEITGANVQLYSRKRRSHKALLDISSSISIDLELYTATLEMIRELYLETQDPSLGTLRLDLTMTMHESDATEITENDPCHGLAWSLDACIMKQIMDESRKLEIQKYFDNIDSDNAPYGDIALILTSPYSRHILAQYLLSILEKIAANADISQYRSAVSWPSVMINIGLSAHKLLSNEGAFSLPKPPAAAKSFFNALIPFIKEAQKFDRTAGVRDEGAGGGSNAKRLRLSTSGSYSSGVDSGHGAGELSSSVIEESGLRPSESDYKAIKTSEIARQVLYAFLLKRVASLDIAMLSLWLPAIGGSLAEFLTISGDAIKDSLPTDGKDAETTLSSPSPPDIQASSGLFAFELDAFVQSLVSHIRGTNGLAAAVMNTINDQLDQANADITRVKAPLLEFLDRVGQARHSAHEQAILFLTECERAVSTEYSSGGGSSASSLPTSPLPGSKIRVQHKETAVYFIYQFVEHIAANYVVDPKQLSSLKQAYAGLETASPQQAFKYRICSANCTHAAKFL